MRGLHGEVFEDKEQDALEKKHMDGLIRVKQIVNIFVKYSNAHQKTSTVELTLSPSRQIDLTS